MIVTMILIIAIVILLAAFFGFAMVRGGGYDGMSFAFLVIFVGFALAISFSIMIVS